MANHPKHLYPTDISDTAWRWLAPLLPRAREGGRPRTTDLRAVLNAIFYLLRTGCQWRLLPREYPAWGTVYHYFRTMMAYGLVCSGLYINACASAQAAQSVHPS